MQTLRLDAARLAGETRVGGGTVVVLRHRISEEQGGGGGRDQRVGAGAWAEQLSRPFRDFTSAPAMGRPWRFGAEERHKLACSLPWPRRCQRRKQRDRLGDSSSGASWRW